MNALIERINWEYSNYYNQLACTSKANIFGKSAEIERRKRIAIYLRSIAGQLSEEKGAKLLAVENLIESADLVAAEHPEQAIERSAEDYIAGVLGEESPNKMHL